MSITREQVRPISLTFEDDGLIPNSPLPLLIYKHAVNVAHGQPEKAIEDLFASNGWGDMWRDGIYNYQHYHANVHEVLGVARGRGLVLFGGESGEAVELMPGDVAILPAGTGHKKVFSSHDFMVIGAYPPGPAMQISRPTPDNYRAALQSIPEVALPQRDPVYGADGPMLRLWAA